jgi:Family of unknown function (DUF6788)
MSKPQSKQQLLRRLLKTARLMVQGGLSETTRRCGNRNCICHRDPTQRHGPHLYLTYRSEGKSRALYVPHEHAEPARQAQAAWKEFWEVACELAAENREQLRERMRGQESAARQRKADG